MCGVWIGAAICSMHDVMNPGGEMWNGDGRCLELYGCVGSVGVGTVPGAMVIEVLNRWER